MYNWKCWRESRNRVITFLILLVSTGVMFAWLAGTQPRGSGHGAPRMTAADLWRGSLLTLGFMIVGFAGLGLGASGVGEEFEQGTVEFLLTRPRRRRYFVWTAWATGAAALFIMVALDVLGSFATFVYVTESPSNWRMPVMIVPLFVPGAVVYSLTYFMTALLKNGRAGLSTSLGLFVLYCLLPVALNLPWVVDFLHRRIDLPTPVDVLAGASKWATIPGAHFPLVTTLGWCLVALAFPLAAQFFFERAEV
jgi:ABC-type transport system involved in multi-copper enzyme maturation permease subunit